MTLTIFILACLSVGLFFTLNTLLKSGLSEIKHDYATANGRYGRTIKESDSLKADNQALEKDVNETIALFDITNQICKSLDLDAVFAAFKEQLPRYVAIRDCQFINDETLLSGYGSYLIVPFKIDNSLIGYLAVDPVDVQDKDKVLILAHQLMLGMRRAALYKRVQELAITDRLTNIFSRRYFLERLDEELARSAKFHYNLSVLMIDIDHFKKYNDRYGHLVGDAILREVSKVIKENIRQIDLLGRYGGEEFCLALSETDKDQALVVAERIRENVSRKHFEIYDEELTSTISIGISAFPLNATDRQELIEKADAALYKAKGAGRNCVRACA